KEFNMKFSKEQMDAIGGFAGFLTEAESKFAGGADKLSQTAIGRLSTITDTVKSLFRKAGMGMLEAMKPRLDKIVAWFDGNKDTVERWKDLLMRFGQEGAERFLSFFERAFTRLGRILDDPKFQKLDFWGKVKFIIDDISAGIKDWLDSGGRDKIVAVGREIGGFLFTGIKMGVTEALKGLGKLNLEALKKPTAENIGSAVLADVLAIGAGSALLGPVFRLGKWAIGLGGRILGRGAAAGAGVAAEAAAETAATTTAASRGFNLGQLLREWFVNPASKRALEPIKRTVIPGTPEQIYRYRGFLPGSQEVEAFREAGTAARTVGGGWAPMRYIGKFGKVGNFLSRLSRWAVPLTLATGAAEVAFARPEERLQTGMKVGGRLAGGLAGASLGAKAGAAMGTLIAPGVGTVIGGAIGGLGGGIAGAIGGESVTKWLFAKKDAITAWGKNTGKAIGGFFTETLPDFFTKTIPSAASRAGTAISNFGTKIGDSIGEFFTKTVPNFLTVQVPYAIGYAAGAVKKFFTQTLPQGWDNLWSSVGNFFTQSIPAWWTGTIVPAWNNFWASVGNFFTQTIPAWATGAYNTAVNFFTVSVPAFFTGLWDSVYGFFTETIPTWATWAYEKADEFFTQKVPEFFTGLWDSVTAFVTEKIPEYAKGLKDKISGWLDSFKDWAGNIWDRVKSSFSAGYEAGSGEGLNVAKHAFGGILTRPHLGLVAEAGPEAIIPLSARMRPRALELWRETGRRLGVQQFEFGGFTAPVVVAGAGMGAPTINLNFDLAGLVGQITVQAREDLDQSADQIAAVIAAKLKTIFYNLPG
ncbi:MAG: hypothetical protein HPY81_10970, partial [Firmicutes bacterium]|nr:hypothetical protein [Bacillota bacterium]